MEIGDKVPQKRSIGTTPFKQGNPYCSEKYRVCLFHERNNRKESGKDHKHVGKYDQRVVLFYSIVFAIFGDH